jgi:hypothetical protein
MKTTSAQEPHARSMKRLNESLFSLNVGFAVAYALFAYDGSWYIALRGPDFIRKVLVGFSTTLLRIAPVVVHMRTKGAILRSNLIREGVFLILIFGVALFLYLFVCAFERNRLAELIFRYISGITALIAVPGAWFYVVNTTRRVSDPDMFWGTSGYIFLLEVTIVGGLIYLLRNQPVWRGTFVFALHYLFWVFIVVCDGHFLAPSVMSVLLSFLFPYSGFAWLGYFRASASHESPGPQVLVNS